MPRFGTHTLEFDVVIATEDQVLDARHFNVLYGVFSACGADYFAYVEPKMFQAFFLQTDPGTRRANDLVDSLTFLKKLMPDYVGLGVGRTQGTLAARFDWTGKIKQPPIGADVKKAGAQAAANRG
jgi:hypothetical protein